jgi:hypothetical protein
MLYFNLLRIEELNQNQILSKSWTLFHVSCTTSILYRGSRMLRENVCFQYRFRITDGNRPEGCGELPPCKGMKLPPIVAELAAVYHEDAFDENIVKYWLHEITLYHSDLSDQPSSGRPPFEDIDARILQVLEA